MPSVSSNSRNNLNIPCDLSNDNKKYSAVNCAQSRHVHENDWLVGLRGTAKVRYIVNVSLKKYIVQLKRIIPTTMKSTHHKSKSKQSSNLTRCLGMLALPGYNVAELVA